MDNCGKWWPTKIEADALQKQQRDAAVQRWKVAVIVGSLFLAALFGFLLGRHL